MKWIIPGVLGALALAFAVFVRNSVKVEYVNGLPAYTDQPGREFVLERDCYIFKFKDRNTSWPLIGSHLTVPDLPEKVDPKSIGASYPNARILGVLHTGQRFRIVSVRRDRSRSETKVTFEILLNDEDNQPFPRLDAYWILDHAPEATGQSPRMLPAYAVSGRAN